MKLLYCLTCGKELRGRSDKKYCDIHCKSVYHNKNKAAHELTIQKTNRILRKNRSILVHFCPIGKNTVRKEVLDVAGFHFHYFTNTFSFKTGTYYFCYDYGFLPIFDKAIKKVLIVQKQDYMNVESFDFWK